MMVGLRLALIFFTLFFLMLDLIEKTMNPCPNGVMNRFTPLKNPIMRYEIPKTVKTVSRPNLS